VWPFLHRAGRFLLPPRPTNICRGGPGRESHLAVAVSGHRDWKDANAGQVQMDLERGRIGFMSTQRRENRWQRTSCTESAEQSGHTSPGLSALFHCADATVGTAPPGSSAGFHPSDKSLSQGAPEWLATNSLQSDHRTIQLVRPVRFVNQTSRRGSPPFRAGRRVATGTPANHASSLPRIPTPSGSDCLHPTLPQAPAG
jgi:hypothetical protein